MADENKIGVEAVFQDANFQKGLANYDQKLADSTKKTTAETGKAADGYGKVQSAIKTLGLAIGATFVVNKIKSFVSSSLAEFARFEVALKEVFTLMPGMTELAMSEMQTDVLNLVKETNRLSTEIIPALYQALSAGIPKENVFEFMKAAHLAAKAGVTDLQTAVDGLTSVVNAYGVETISATEAADIMFAAVKSGKTTFELLSDRLFQVVPVAAALGVEFGNVTAAIATMTSQGTPTRVAATQLRAMLQELADAGSDVSLAFLRVSGQTFPQFIQSGGNLQGALEIVQEAAEKAGVSMLDMFSSIQAGMASLQLTGAGASIFAYQLDQAALAAGGVAEAAATMSDTTAKKFKEVTVAAETMRISFGDAVKGMVASWSEAEVGIFGFLTAIFQQVTAWEEAKIAAEEYGAGLKEQKDLVSAIRLENEDLISSSVSVETQTRRSAIAIDLLNNGMGDLWAHSRIGRGELRGIFEAFEDAGLSAEAYAKVIARVGAQTFKSGADFVHFINQMIFFESITEKAGGSVGTSIEVYEQFGNVVVEDAEAFDQFAAALEEATANVEAFFVSALQASEASATWAGDLLDFAVSVGATSSELETLARSTGMYTEAQIENAILQVQMKERMAELMLQVEQNRTTHEAAIATLQAEFGPRVEYVQSLFDAEAALEAEAEATGDNTAAKAAATSQLILYNEAVHASKVALGEYFDEAVTSAEGLGLFDEVAGSMVLNQQAVNQAMYDAAAAAGAPIEALAGLGVALGIFSDEQAEAALKTAVLIAKINEIAAAVAAGDLTWAQAIGQLDTFKARLDQDFQLIVDTGNLDASMTTAQAGIDRVDEKIAGLEGKSITVETNAEEVWIGWDATRQLIDDIAARQVPPVEVDTNLEDVTVALTDVDTKMLAMEESLGAAGTTVEESATAVEEAAVTIQKGSEAWIEAVGLAAEENATALEETSDAAVDSAKETDKAVKSAAEDVKEAATEMSDAVAESTGQMATSVDQNMGKVVTAVSTGMLKALSSAQGYKDDFVYVGWNLAFGMAEGVISGEGVLVQAVIKIVEAALQAAKDASEETSPSKAMYDIGEDFWLGFWLATKDMEEEIGQGVGQVATNAIEILEKLLGGELLNMLINMPGTGGFAEWMQKTYIPGHPGEGYEVVPGSLPGSMLVKKGNKLVDVFDPAYQAYEDAVEKFQQQLNEAIGKLTGAIQKAGGTPLSLHDWINDLLKKAGYDLDPTKDWAIGGLIPRGTNMKDYIDYLLDYIGKNNLWDELAEQAGMSVEEMKEQFADMAAEFSGDLEYMSDEWLEFMDFLLGKAGQWSSIGGSLADIFEEQTLDPIQEQMDKLIENLQGVFDLSDEEILANLPELLEEARELGLGGEVTGWLEELIGLNDEYIAQQERILELQEKQAQLDLLKTQLDLLNLIKESGLDAAELLEGIELGLDADIASLLDVVNMIIQSMIDEANENLGIDSPSTVFEEMGHQVMAGLSKGIYEAAEILSGVGPTSVSTSEYTTNRAVQINFGGVSIHDRMDAALFEERIRTVVEESI